MFSLFKRAHAALARQAEVGWIIDAEKAGFIWAEPTRVRTEESDQTHAKSLRVCPAMLDHEARLFEVACPIDLRVKLARNFKASTKSKLAFHHHLLDLGNRLGRVQALGASLGAIHDRVAAVKPERIFQIIQAVTRCLIA